MYPCGVVHNSGGKAVVAAAADPAKVSHCLVLAFCSRRIIHYSTIESDANDSRHSREKDVLSSFDKSFDAFYSMKCVKSDRVLHRLATPESSRRDAERHPINEQGRVIERTRYVCASQSQIVALTDRAARGGVRGDDCCCSSLDAWRICVGRRMQPITPRHRLEC